MNLKRKLPAIFIFCFLSAVTVASGPRYAIREYTTRDGLAQRRVSGILQDARGFMWFSTWNGLNRFDGYSFESYTHATGEYGRLSNVRINNIWENSLGDIWAITHDNRVFLFDTWTEKYLDVLAPVEENFKRHFRVTSVHPLEKGVTWITCSDGYAFRVEDDKVKQGEGITAFSTYDKTLKSENIFGIHQDSDGDEWLLTDQGVTILGRKEVTTEVPVVFFCENGSSILMASVNGKLLVYDKKTEVLGYPKPDFPTGQIFHVTPSGESSYVLATEGGVWTFDFSDGSFRNYDISGAGPGFGAVNDVFIDSEGTMWAISPSRGIVWIDPESADIRAVYVHLEPVTTYFPPYSVYQDRHGTVWIIPLAGEIFYYDPRTEGLQSVVTVPESPVPGHSVFVGIYYEDNQGNLWVAHSNGVSRISFSEDYARFVPEDTDNETRALFYDHGGRLWSGSKSGALRVYDPATGSVLYLHADGRLDENHQVFAGAGIYTVFEDSEGRIWIGTKGDGLFVLKPLTEKSFRLSKYVHDSTRPFSISDDEVYSVFEDSRGRIWIGCFREGINLVEVGENGEFRFINRRNRIKQYPGGGFTSVRYLTEGPDGVILVGTAGGLLTFDAGRDDWEGLYFYRNVHRTPEGTGMSGGNVMHILRTRKNEIFVTTFDGGFQKAVSDRLLSDTLRFRNYHSGHDNTIPGLVLAAVEDTGGQIWIISEDAVTCFDPVCERFELFNVNTFIRGNYFSEAIPLIDRQGRILTGMYGGYLLFHPGDIIRSDDVPPVVFTEIVLKGSETEKLFRCDSLVLDPDIRNLMIRFSSLDYLDAEGIRYAYRLEGLESDWNYTSENRSVSYVNLPKGRYRFQVRSTDSKGHWVENTAVLPICIMPRFRETGLARVLFGFILTGIIAVGMFVVSYVYRLRYRVAMERQLADVKLRFFTDISHELRTPLTLISSPVSEVLEQESLSPHAREYLTVVRKNVDRMMQLVNQILDFRKIQSKKMKLLVEYTDINRLLERITEEFRLMAEEKKIDLRLEATDDSVKCWIDRDKFEKIVFNLLSNAFKFTLSGKPITVRLGQNERQVIVSVIDKGVGIPEGKLAKLFERFESTSAYDSLQPSSGIGLSMVRELTWLHHGEVDVTSRENEGSEFRVIFRKGRAHFEKDKHAELIVSDSNGVVEQEAVPGAKSTGELPEADEPDGRPALLVVEDNPELAGFLVSVLSKDYRVWEAANGKEGLKLAFTRQPDFILTDVMMPVMDGLEMIREIKNNPDTCHIPIVVLSAKSSLDDRIHALEYGIDDYITKPFSASYLKTRIATLIDQRRRLQEQILSGLAGVMGSGVSEISPSKPHVVPFDQKFMERLMVFMEDNMDNAELAVDDLAVAMDMSRSILYRKLKSVVGLSPVDFIRAIRIKRAMQLIDTGEFTFSQIAYMTGFGDPKYFGKSFKREVGVTPSEYKAGKKS